MIPIFFITMLLLFTDVARAAPLLPMDPGRAGKQGLNGIDADNNGVRDDIQRYIDDKYPDDENVRLAMTQVAIEYQALLVEANDPEAAVLHATRLARHEECLDYLVGEAARTMLAKLKAEILNTPERSRAYIEFNENLAGSIIIGAPLKEWKNSCSFNLDVDNDSKGATR